MSQNPQVIILSRKSIDDEFFDGDVSSLYARDFNTYLIFNLKHCEEKTNHCVLSAFTRQKTYVVEVCNSRLTKNEKIYIVRDVTIPILIAFKTKMHCGYHTAG